MRFLFAICLGILCVAHAFPHPEAADDDDDDDVDKRIKIPEVDKALIFKLAEKGSYLMVYMMTSPSGIIMQVVNSILDTKKADQHILDDLQNRLIKANSSSDSYYSSKDREPTPDYLKDITQLFSIYSKPENLEKRNRFNLWTNGQFDIIVGKYYQDAADLQKSFIDTAKSISTELSEYTRNKFRYFIEKLNTEVEEKQIFDAAMTLHGKLTYYAKIY